MRDLPRVGALLLAAVALGAGAASPPAYLRVPDFNRCLAEQDQGGYRTWCLPAERPAACPEASWQQLQDMTGADRVPECAGR